MKTTAELAALLAELALAPGARDPQVLAALFEARLQEDRVRVADAVRTTITEAVDQAWMGAPERIGAETMGRRLMHAARNADVWTVIGQAKPTAQ